MTLFLLVIATFVLTPLFIYFITVRFTAPKQANIAVKSALGNLKGLGALFLIVVGLLLFLLQC